MEDNLDMRPIDGSDKPDYYYNKGKGKKIQDIFIGIGVGALFFMILWGIGTKFYQSIGTIFTLGFICYFASLMFFFTKGRRFIAIGLIILIFVPIIMIGGCLTFIGIR